VGADLLRAGRVRVDELEPLIRGAEPELVAELGADLADRFIAALVADMTRAAGRT
jgi:hypothetical protein